MNINDNDGDHLVLAVVPRKLEIQAVLMAAKVTVLLAPCQLSHPVTDESERTGPMCDSGQ